MGEALRIFFELLRLGRSADALAARATLLDVTSVRLRKRAARKSGVKAKRIHRRADRMMDRASDLRARARKKGVLC